MSMRMQLAVGVVVGLAIGSVPATAAPIPASLKQTTVKDAKFSHGLILKARKHDEADFSDKTRKFGVECYKDENNSLTVYISEAGSIATVPAMGTASGGMIKDAKFSHGLVLKARKSDESDFTPKTARFGVECYKDENNNVTLYITENGAITAVPGVAVAAGGMPKDAKFSHGLVVKARKHDEPNFDDKTKKYGVECFKDDNNNTTLYISETGSLSAAPGGALAGDPVKGAKFSHGLILKARKHDELEFTDKTKKFGVECFKDENNSNGLYITEIGTISIVPGAATATGSPKDAKFTHGIVLKARKFDEPDFTSKTTRYGVECFKDENNSVTLYIAETGTTAGAK